ncbi:tetratricopeptide repeat-containing protein [Maritimibacter sp. 55A14]|uniref:tetratricopeptide repeat protein n=1 Tax=Maritimibacter sp. 55A14 TaxID=2174844 RepID=UPI000D61B362|nr:tetratricopeptide repeat protein [Maritimibacter sp. 55A14]PWE34369.1 tetratricopeptide repeat-containing protein [Maritimibacter sp. 55A14]
MQTDIYGNDISLAAADAAESWNAMMQAFLAHGASVPDHLARVIAAEPQFGLAHAVKGLFMLTLGRRELVAVAAEALAAARAAPGATARERLYTEALAEWLAGRPTQAVARLEAVLGMHPQDALAMKLSHAIRFIMGDRRGMLSSVEAVLPAYGADHPARGYLLGCRSFALEENGFFDDARLTGIEGMQSARDDAWGLHAVAHVHDMTANSAAGLAWLEANEGAWDHCNNFRYHVWWHKALMHLDQGDLDSVFSLYDAKIRKDHTDDFRDISNGTSLLMRLELDGHDVGSRWEELADLSENRIDDGCLVFADLHYLLALVGDGRKEAAARLVARISRDADSDGVEVARICADPGRAAAEGLELFGEGAYAPAFHRLASARAGMQRIGGSHAQRDVFERLTIDAGIRAGYLNDAEKIILERSAMRAGAEDAYAASRRELIGRMRRQALAMPAE